MNLLQLVELLGFGLITAGVLLFSLPAGLIVAGLLVAVWAGFQEVRS